MCVCCYLLKFPNTISFSDFVQCERVSFSPQSMNTQSTLRLMIFYVFLLSFIPYPKDIGKRMKRRKKGEKEKITKLKQVECCLRNMKTYLIYVYSDGM